MRRQMFLAGFASAVLLPSFAVQGRRRRTNIPLDCIAYREDWGTVPGDEGYGHEGLMHTLFGAVFGHKCKCNGNECRETICRETKLGSMFGLDIQVNRSWYPIDKDFYRPKRAEVFELLQKRGLEQHIEKLYVSGKAFVCAYPHPQTPTSYCSGMQLRCGIINATLT